MSRLFPDRVVLELRPSEIVVSRPRGAYRGQAKPATVPCEAGIGPEPWRGAVAALSSTRLGHCRLTVELSSHFVRYALVPWSDALATAAEEEAYLRHHFGKVHGERARDWAFRASEAPPGALRLASAVDRALIDEIKATAKRQPGVKLVSIQPQLMSRFNAWRAAVPALGAWIVIAEDDRACIALHGRDGWRSVQSARGEWQALLERARVRTEGDMPEVVLLDGATAPPGGGVWTFREMRA